MLHLRGVVSNFSTFPSILLLFSGVRASNIKIPYISPGTSLQGERRAVISFAEHQTTEDRHAYLQAVKDEGYACWMISDTPPAAICVQSAKGGASGIPKNAEGLRRTLAKVSLREWLSSLLCPPMAQLPNDGQTSIDSDDWKPRNVCLEVVEAALATQPPIDVYLQYPDRITTISATVDDTPWLKVLQSFVGTSFRPTFDPFDCSTASIALASMRAKIQLLPALRALVHRSKSLTSTMTTSTNTTEKATDATTVSRVATPGSFRKQAQPTSVEGASVTDMQHFASATGIAGPSVEKIESLLSLLDGGNERNGITTEMPILRMTFPKPHGRMSGGVLAFKGEVSLGSELTRELMSTTTTTTTSDTRRSQAEGVMSEEEFSDDKNGSSSGPNSGGGGGYSSTEHKKLMTPEFDRCVVRVFVDDALASTIPVDMAAAPNGNHHGENHAVMVIESTFIPAYDRNPRCSEHPAKASTAISTGGGAWDNDDQAWRLEARTVDKVCTKEAFGAHRIHSELACRSRPRDSTVREHDSKLSVDNTAKDGSARSAVPHQKQETPPPSEQKLEGSAWEVLATSGTVEYFHTGHLANVLSPPPWSAGVGEGNYYYASEENGNGLGVSNPLLGLPPEELSVSLYLDSDPDETAVEISVPRWFSDGEVWEAAFDACSKGFGQIQGVLVKANDCVDLVTRAIADKRMDLFHTMSLRLNAYLRSVNPNFSFEGHTGWCPQKVEALGAVSREGGGRASTICEVGFNAGHSSLNWLLSSRTSTRVLAFDLGEHEYMRHSMDFLQAVFPGRLELIVGDSSVIVPGYAAAEESAGRDPRVCNVIFVDGDHTEAGAYADLVNFRAMASRNWNVLAIDDLEFPSVEAAWRRFREHGGGTLERVVQSIGEHYADAQENGSAGWEVRKDATGHGYFMRHGHFSLGIGRYWIE